MIVIVIVMCDDTFCFLFTVMVKNQVAFILFLKQQIVSCVWLKEPMHPSFTSLQTPQRVKFGCFSHCL